MFKDLVNHLIDNKIEATVSIEKDNNHITLSLEDSFLIPREMLYYSIITTEDEIVNITFKKAFVAPF